MMLTLWRGSECLGELWSPILASLDAPPYEETGRPPTLVAVLMPRHSVVLESVWQFRVLLGSPGVVGQHHIDPDIVSERASNHTQRGTAGPVVLKPMTAEEAQGISVDRQFRIVDTDGNELPVRSIQVMESRCEAKDYSTLLRELPITALVNGSVWTVFIVFDAPVG